MKVQPIRDLEKIKEIESRLAADRTERGRRKYLVFVCGIYLARRVCDILPMKVKELRDQSFVQIKEDKTGKIIELPIPDHLRKVLRRELKGKDGNDYVFMSRQRGKDGVDRPICYKTSYLYLKEIATVMGLPYNVATHSMRKTFGYHYYQRTKDIATLMVLYNHSTEKDTKVYIGIELDEITAAVKGFKF